jgi:hypothetical protein
MNFDLIPPKQWDSFFDLYGQGRVYFGRATFGKGMHVGMPPIMAMFQDIGYYPDEPFIVSSKKSMHKINAEMKNNPFVPDWLRADCFEYFYKREIINGKVQKLGENNV